jgi:hypothetical protein
MVYDYVRSSRACASGPTYRNIKKHIVLSFISEIANIKISEIKSEQYKHNIHEYIHKLTCMVYGYLPLSPLYVSLSIIPISQFGFQNQVMLTTQ